MLPYYFFFFFLSVLLDLYHISVSRPLKMTDSDFLIWEDIIMRLNDYLKLPVVILFLDVSFLIFFSFSVGVIFFYFSGKSTSIRTDFFLKEDWRNPLDKSFIQLLAFFQETLLSFCGKGTELVQ